MYYAYVLQSLKTNEYYKGITNNPLRRIKEHFLGKSRWSKNKMPLRLVHVEVCTNRLEARHMEKFFKSGFGREIIIEINKEINY